MLILIPGSDASHWACFSPFNPDPPVPIRWSARDASGRTIPATVYDISEDDPLAQVLNLRLDLIADAYAQLPFDATVLAFATQTILRLISVADETPARRQEFLAGALQLAEWVLTTAASVESPMETFPYKVNRWQILHRLGRMNEDEVASVRDLRRAVRRLDTEFALTLEAACCVLLGDETELNQALGEMTADRLAEFQGWPIWTLAHDSARKHVGHNADG